MSSFVSYNFNSDSAGTLLEDCASETGGGWSKNASFTGSAAVTSAHRLRGNGGVALYCAAGVPSSADYAVQADFVPQTLAGSAGILARSSASAETYYLLDYESGPQKWNLYTVVNGAVLNSASFSQTLTPGTTYTAVLTCNGSAISATVNGTPILSYTDTNIPAAGLVGVYFGQADTDSTDIHLDNYSAALLAPPTITIAPNDSRLFYSPYNWYLDGSTYSQTNTPGAYLKFDITADAGGSVTLNLDTTPLNGITAANCPTIVWSVDGQAMNSQLLAYATGTTQVPLAESLTAGAHTFVIWFRSVALSSSSAPGDRWNTPASVVRITGVVIDSGSTPAAPTLNANRMIVYGDSITEGADAVGSANGPNDQDATQTYAQLLGDAMNAETGAIGFAGQGWTVSGYGNVPAFPLTFDKYFAGTSRLTGGALSPAPDFAVVLQGKNDASQSATDSAVTAAVTSWLEAFRADAPTTTLFVVIPFDGSKRSAITAGFNAAAVSNTWLIDLGTALEPTLNSGGLNTNDGIHPDVRGHATFAALLAGRILATVVSASFAGADGQFDGGSTPASSGAFNV